MSRLTEMSVGAFGLVWCVGSLRLTYDAHGLRSSSKDQLTGSSVAIKKIMKPFSTPVLSKRTYRELKLLKHIQHENVRFRRAMQDLLTHELSTRVDYQP